MEIVIINPGLIIGPHLNGGQFASADIIKNFMLGQYDGLVECNIPLVDVRDVAEVHLNAVYDESAANKRLIVVSEYLSLQEISTTLK